MLINGLNQYGITASIDIQQAVVIAQALNMVLSSESGLQELEDRMAQLGQTSFTRFGILASAEQALDILCKATNIPPYCSCCHGNEEESQDGPSGTEEDAGEKQSIN